jgi:hypothetical protein
MIEDFIFYLQDDIEMYINTDYIQIEGEHHPTHQPPAEMSLAPSIPHVDLPGRSGQVSTNGSPSKSSSYWGTQLLEPTIYHIDLYRIYRWQKKRVKSYY